MKRPGLLLDLPDIPGEGDLAVPGPTDNGATVMNAELLERLNRAERRSGYRPQSGSLESGEFQAGNWVEFIRDGDRCFRVVRADPLQPGSIDMWYRVACG